MMSSSIFPIAAHITCCPSQLLPYSSFISCVITECPFLKSQLVAMERITTLKYNLNNVIKQKIESPIEYTYICEWAPHFF